MNVVVLVVASLLIFFQICHNAGERDYPVVYDGAYRPYRMGDLKKGDAILCADLEEFIRLKYEITEGGIDVAWAESDVERRMYILYVRGVNDRRSETGEEEEA